MERYTLINWNWVRALRAREDTFRVVSLLPVGRLTSGHEIGPHYHPSTVEAAVFRSNHLINHANLQNADLVLAPEYSLPRLFVTDLLSKNTDRVRDGVIYVFPIESISHQSYKDFEKLNGPSVKVKLGRILEDDESKSVNSCAVISRNGETIHALFQAKMTPAPIEEGIMALGDEVFVIEGKKINLVVAICADLNRTETHNTWHSALSEGDSAILVHPQWNPASDYRSFETFWDTALDNINGARRMIFSLNWANESEIFEKSEGRIFLTTAKSRIFRGSALKTTVYGHRKNSLAGMSLQLRRLSTFSSRKYELWHVSNIGDTIWTWDLVRPITTAQDATQPRRNGLRSASVVRCDAHTAISSDEIVPELTKKFWASTSDAEEISADQCPALSGASPFDIDRFCSSCCMDGEDECWIKDPSERPSASDCTPRRKKSPEGDSIADSILAEEIGYTAACVRAFLDAQVDDLSVAPVDQYPLNLTDNNNAPKGWLFHGLGRSARKVQRIASMLLGETLQCAEHPINLYAYFVDGDIDPDKIGPNDISVENPGSPDITNPEHGRQVYVTNLERRVQ